MFLEKGTGMDQRASGTGERHGSKSKWNRGEGWIKGLVEQGRGVDQRFLVQGTGMDQRASGTGERGGSKG